MAVTLDHLRVDHIVHVIRRFSDANGAEHQPGEQGLITKLDFKSSSGELSITWEREARQETLVFLLSCKTGPGNGRMRQFFEMGAYVPSAIEGKRLIPGFGYVPLAPTLPPLDEQMIESDARFDDAMNRAWALAGQQRFDEAQAQLLTIANTVDRRGDNHQPVARALCARARLHAFDDDLSVYHWLRDSGIHFWYAWGAGAGSGGEGAYRATLIRSAEREFVDLERRLGR